MDTVNKGAEKAYPSVFLITRNFDEVVCVANPRTSYEAFFLYGEAPGASACGIISRGSDGVVLFYDEAGKSTPLRSLPEELGFNRLDGEWFLGKVAKTTKDPVKEAVKDLVAFAQMAEGLS